MGGAAVARAKILCVKALSSPDLRRTIRAGGRPEAARWSGVLFPAKPDI